MNEKKIRWGRFGLDMFDKSHMPNEGFRKIFIKQKGKSEKTNKQSKKTKQKPLKQKKKKLIKWLCFFRQQPQGHRRGPAVLMVELISVCLGHVLDVHAGLSFRAFDTNTPISDWSHAHRVQETFIFNTEVVHQNAVMSSGCGNGAEEECHGPLFCFTVWLWILRWMN